MTDSVLWTLEKNGHKARAATKAIAGVGIELRFLWDDDLRQSRVYRNSVELAAAADEKKRELLSNGWREAPPIVWGN